MSRFGARGAQRFTPTISAIVPAATISAAGFKLPRAAQSTSTFCTISAGSAPGRLSPSKSLIWLAKMMTAIPAVNPTVTG